MAWYDQDSWLTAAFAPRASTMLVTFLLMILVPVLLHHFLYRSTAAASTPTFVVLGPSGSGKTSLVTHLELGAPSPTHTSVLPQTVSTALPPNLTPASQAYRSANDAETRAPKPLLLTDTPGHGKLRSLALDALEPPQQGGKKPAGVIFVVDAAGLGGEDPAAPGGLREAAGYLHDVLLRLQRQQTAAKAGSGRRRDVPVLVAANKMDLFTALPAGMVRASLEAEIARQRSTRARGIAGAGSAGKGEGLDAGVDAAAAEDVDENDLLAGEAEGKFEFARMAEWGVAVAVVGGSAAGEEASVEKWWEWVAEQV